MNPPDVDTGKLWTTYKMADGTDVYDEWSFVTDAEFFEDIEEPMQVVEERWHLVESTTRWFFPRYGRYCGFEVDEGEPCEEEAVRFGRKDGGEWEPLCAAHKEALGSEAEYVDVT